ncbi:MAG: 4-hydroxythreonine-4-phosphate dehydrogenase PdxA [Candidatus Omnitrophota bacterium]
MHISSINKPCVFITMGDPSGIGPEIIIRSMASSQVRGLAIFVVIGDEGIFRQAASYVGENIDIRKIDIYSGKIGENTGANVIDLLDPTPPLLETSPGVPTREGAQKALDCLKFAADIMTDPCNNYPKTLVTAPLSKERIADIEKGFIGHTEYLQRAYSSDFVTMVMKGKNLCVVPVTRHIPISEVALSLTQEKIEKTLKQVIEKRALLSEKEHPRIAVTALNPHCGEGGKIGTEEKLVIEPAIKNSKKIYPHIEGPISADVVFNRALKGETEIIICMYHDQGLGPFKTIDFDSGVNITLGLDHIRTSPDHGTAFDIAGKGIASPESMKEAIKLAVRSWI